MITLVRAAFVIGYEGGDHVIIRDGEVAYEGETIIFVGKSFPGTPDKVIDAGEAILGPGFIDLDALADIDHALIDSWHGPETATGLDWSEDYFLNRRHDVFSPADRDFRHEFAFTQLIRNGITTAMPIGGEMHNEWCETYDEWAAAASIAGRLGLRLYAGPSYRAGVNVVRADGTRDVLWNEALGEAGFADAVRFIEDFDGAHDGLIRGALLPARIETMTPELMRKTAAASRRLGVKVRLHCLQGLKELRLLDARYGKTPLDLLDETGLLGPDLLIPHAIFLDSHSRNPNKGTGDLERLASSGATVIHCPMTSLRYGTALESFPKYRAAGVKFAMGTDSYPPDMIRNIDIGVHIPKVIEGRTDAGGAAEIYRAATLGGAAALGRDDLGRLAVGAKADMIVVDLTNPRVGMIEDPIRTLHMNCTGADISTVIINGRTVMEDRNLPGVDAEAMSQRLKEYYATMKAGYSERDYQRRPVDEIFPPTFRAAI
ncbi:MAG: N-ethylammeline chlorohydrolase [Devosia sp.]|uniref:chlorohydrolase family protein n=1 Tax=Devosia sp. TaxID=1871048 RepID=UPI002630D8BD|nr:chlorohydrolase family protein [Devosia sp.]MDB5531046.1 N-ethylammeline chlorohydrolase [Devosia sp.]